MSDEVPSSDIVSKKEGLHQAVPKSIGVGAL